MSTTIGLVGEVFTRHLQAGLWFGEEERQNARSAQALNRMHEQMTPINIVDVQV